VTVVIVEEFETKAVARRTSNNNSRTVRVILALPEFFFLLKKAEKRNWISGNEMGKVSKMI
jgi:hypothetical protein